MKRIILFSLLLTSAVQMSAQAVRTEETKGSAENIAGYTYITYEATSKGAGRLSEEFPTGQIKCNRIILHGELNGTDIVYLRKNLVLNQPSDTLKTANPFECRMWAQPTNPVGRECGC